MKQVVVSSDMIRRQPQPRGPASRVALSVAVVAVISDWVTPPGYVSGVLVLCAAGLLLTMRSPRLALLTVLASSWIVCPAIGTGLYAASSLRERPRLIAVPDLLGTSIPGLAPEELELCGAQRFDVETWSGPFMDTDIAEIVVGLHNGLVMNRAYDRGAAGCDILAM